LFTGIVEEAGTVRSIGSGKLTVSACVVLEGSRIGDSVAVNGACLTVTALDSTSFSVDVMPETLRRTSLGQLRPGSRVNLERALLVGGRIGGHLVQGHVDATGSVISLTPQGGAIIAGFAAGPEVLRYVVEKGFIAVDGVSLTVVAHDRSSFSVSLVGFTLNNTILGSRKVGDQVNLEVDIMAKYVEKLGKGGGGVTLDFLSEQGFTSTGRGT
jgi:riboflavin synthase